MDWDNLFSGDPRAEGVHADSIPDGLILSLSNLGRVDIEYISAITGADLKTVICTLKGSIYQNPDTWGECFYKGWETAEEYLSGNMVQKWKTAKETDEKYKGYFAENIKAIEKVLPPSVSAEDIYITLPTGKIWTKGNWKASNGSSCCKLPARSYPFATPPKALAAVRLWQEGFWND